MGFDKVAIIGGGESGVGAALLAKKKGKEVFLSDFGEIKKKYKDELVKLEIPFEEGGHDLRRLSNFEILVKSPGVSDTVPVIRKLREKGLRVISEIEFASYYTKKPIIGITGSNGKTTTTSLVYHLLKEAGRRVELGGNIGKSFARLLFEDTSCEEFVLELSSFQLDGIKEFRPSIAVLLNITPDHLDRYDYKFENYVKAKWRIAMNQEEGDLLIVNSNLDGKSGNAKRIEIREENYIKDLLLTKSGEEFDISRTTLMGLHNRFNALCAIETALHVGLSRKEILNGLHTFKSVPHRLQVLGSYEGVTFINDSKATNVDAVYYALEAMKGNVIWILGGIDKGNDYQVLKDLVDEKVVERIYLGVDNSKLIDFFGPATEVRSMEAALRSALEVSKVGDTILLSPACASFDLFKNYEDRGEQFAKAFENLNSLENKN